MPGAFSWSQPSTRAWNLSTSVSAVLQAQSEPLLTGGILTSMSFEEEGRYRSYFLKKKSGGTLPFLLANGIGKTFLAKDVDLEDVAAFLDEERNR